MKISVADSYYIKGVAIILMFAHHLFAFPDRVIPPNYYVNITNYFNIEGAIGEFGKICVPIFYL